MPEKEAEFGAEEGETQDGKIAFPPHENGDVPMPASRKLLFGFHGDHSGFKTKTYAFLKPEGNPSPTILLIEERSNSGELYLGVLSLTFLW
ncbi:MAG: hypothetical protein JSV16_16505 [Candidatus Hydrogenedentota bacterium]|nr:MAG: hypothetical protein JSV16_16505 [Candidatus Hydrogenedentota bacterium]